MKLKSLAFALGFAAGALVLVGCKHTEVKANPTPTSVAIAKQACEINALAEERDAIITTLNSGDADQGTNLSDKRHTILSEKLRRYSAEVEASYRFVTANCNAYNLCMEKNYYSESACTQSRIAWVESHQKFNELAKSLAHIRRGRDYDGPPRGGPGPGRGCRCTSQGGFSVDCCDDGD